MATPNKRNWGNTKPPLGAQIDWGNPLNVGLVNCYLFNETGAQSRDLASNKNPAVFGSSAVIGYASPGAGLRTDGTANGGASVSSFLLPPTRFSIEGLFTLYVLDGTINCLFRANLGLQSYGFYIWNTDRLVIYPSTDYNSGIDTGFTPVLGVPFHVIAYHAPDLDRIYLNGRPVATGANPENYTNSGTLQVGFDDYGQNADANVSFLKVNNREVTGAEAVHLAAQPYAFIQAPSQRQYFSQIPASGGPWPWHIDNGMAGGMHGMGL